MDGSNVVKDKAERFAIRIVKCSRYIKDRHHEYSLADQLLRSGMSIGAKQGRFYHQVKHCTERGGRNEVLA